MSSPADELPEPSPHTVHNTTQPNPPPRISIDGPSLPSYNVNNPRRTDSHEKSSDGEGTMVGEVDDRTSIDHNEKEHFHNTRPRAGSHLTVATEPDYEPGDPLRTMMSGSRTREQASRLGDDLAMLQIERQISRRAEEDALSRSRSRASEMYRSRSRRRDDHVDEFDEATNPVHEKTQIYKPVEHPATGFAKFLVKIHGSNFLIRYITYIAPLTLILLIPLLLGALVYKEATVGHVYLQWFMIWLEIVWLSLWAGRLFAKALPVPIGVVSSLFTNDSKKWRDMGKQLELPATLFFWWLAIEVSFLPTMTYHQKDVGPGAHPTQKWMNTMNKVLVSIFVGAILNFVEKIIIQLIAISFHLRTYADRIEINKFQIGSLTKLYKFSKEKIAMEDSEFEGPPEPGSGARTPGAIINEAAKTGRAAFTRFGDVAGKVAGDFTGRTVTKSTHPSQVVLALLHTTSGSQVLARRLYRTFARENTETVYSDDLRPAFDNDDEADAAFTMFDKDMNGDISMEELEAVCVEIGRERKSITASLKDLDSVVAKLDDVFMFIVFVITVLVFISLISTSAAGVLTSAGSTVLALSWLFSATAQEFLQSVIFVFVKHPFDVGDRVSIYGNTGSTLKGDDYFVKEISLLYTEFKKMEGHIVQAPNSYLNTLFILNQRRSGGLAEAVSVTIKFGTTLEQIDGLRSKLLEFVQAEKREYQGNILTELRDIVEVHSMNLNVVFFYKSNWQNEGLRLARRNKFICAMMVTMQELEIEGPRMRFPGQRESFPVYLQNIPHIGTGAGHGGHPDHPMGIIPEENRPFDEPFVAPPPGQSDSNGSQLPHSRLRSGSILKNPNRPRQESLSQMNRRVDFSLGAQSFVAGDHAGDVYEARDARRVPIDILEASRERSASRASQELLQQQRSRRESQDATARTSSRDFGPGNLIRRSTDSASRPSVHRNRFFGRPRPGTGEEALMESGMADIPEDPSRPPTAPGSAGRSMDRLDPRSGVISPMAWRSDSQEGPGVLRDMAALRSVPEGHRPLQKSRTEDWEMKRFR